jgi:hypothetical protein
VATLPDKELGGPTWVPVVETKPGWDRVLLPSRPNGSTGWIASDKVQKAKSPYTVKVDTSARRLSLLKSGRSLGTWTVAVGAPKTPTPAGRTFILASLAPSKPTYSPLILPVGAHSEPSRHQWWSRPSSYRPPRPEVAASPRRSASPPTGC